MANGWGGARPGAGRPPGSIKDDPLTKEERNALRAMRYRVPEELKDSDVGEMADEALETIVDVMRQKVHPMYAPTVLKAATLIREEVCGPVVKRIELNMTLAQMLAAATADPDDNPDLLPSIDMRPALPAHLQSIEVKVEAPGATTRPTGTEGLPPDGSALLK